MGETRNATPGWEENGLRHVDERGTDGNDMDMDW